MRDGHLVVVGADRHPESHRETKLYDRTTDQITLG
jgi:hypothetical protein